MSKPLVLFGVAAGALYLATRRAKTVVDAPSTPGPSVPGASSLLPSGFDLNALAKSLLPSNYHRWFDHLAAHKYALSSHAVGNAGLFEKVSMEVDPDRRGSGNAVRFRYRFVIGGAPDVVAAVYDYPPPDNWEELPRLILSHWEDRVMMETLNAELGWNKLTEYDRYALMTRALPQSLEA